MYFTRFNLYISVCLYKYIFSYPYLRKESTSEINNNIRKPLCLEDLYQRMIKDWPSEEKKRYEELSERVVYWPEAYDKPITYAILQNKFMPERYTKRENFNSLRSTIQKAFKFWESSSNLRFMEVDINSNIAEIIISFQKGDHGDIAPFDGHSGVLAHAKRPDSMTRFNAKSTDGDLHYDAEEDWLYHQPKPGEKGTQIFPVTIHELGHSLGLKHNDNTSSIMYPRYEGVSKWDPDSSVLPEIDQISIRNLYGPRKSWVERHWVLLILLGCLIFGIIIYQLLEKVEVIPIDMNRMISDDKTTRSALGLENFRSTLKSFQFMGSIKRQPEEIKFIKNEIKNEDLNVNKESICEYDPIIVPVIGSIYIPMVPVECRKPTAPVISFKVDDKIDKIVKMNDNLESKMSQKSKIDHSDNKDSARRESVFDDNLNSTCIQVKNQMNKKK